MRLKEDSSSYNSSSVMRRDFRQDRSDGKVVAKRKKNTRVWCRGIVGHPHDRKIVWLPWIANLEKLSNRCAKCNKEFYIKGFRVRDKDTKIEKRPF